MLQIVRGRQGGPRRVLFHGTNFIGKTTFASQAFGGCLLINLEDDKDVDMDKTPPIRTWEDLQAWCGAGGYVDLESQKPDWPYKWIAIDTLDAVERLLKKEICRKAGVESMADDKFSYGKGKPPVEVAWNKFHFMMDWLHSERGVGIILLAHSDGRKITPPDAPSYEKWEPSIEPYAADLFCDWCQEVFFGTFETFIVAEDAGFNRTRNMAAGGTERVIHTSPTAGIRAKNRLQMPSMMKEFSFEKYAEFFVPSELLKKG